MSGDVQPRKRKDKKRKRDSLDRKSEGDLVFSRKPSLLPEEEEVIHHGVHATKMGTEDVHLHIQSEHGTGGNWCAKMLFFSLLALLFGLVGLIILENRGLSDLDTPLKESRFSQYFEGWVDENRDDHDDHHIVAHEIEEHDLHDQPFEEVEEPDTNEDHDDEDHDEEHDSKHDDEHDDEHDEDEDENDGDDDDDDDDDNKTAEDNDENEDNSDSKIDLDDDKDDDDDDDDDGDDDDNVASPEDNDNEDDDDDDDGINDEEDEDQNDDDSAEPIIVRSEQASRFSSPAKSNKDGANDDDDDNDDDDNNNSIENEKNDDEDDDDNQKKNNDDGDDDDDDNDESDNKNTDKDDNDDDPFDEHVTKTSPNVPIINQKQTVEENSNRICDKLPKDLKTASNVINNEKKEEYDGTFESLEQKVVDNDAEELRLLQKKAEQASENNNKEDDEPSSSPLAVKIIVGLALALVARLVLIKKGPENVTTKIEVDTLIIEEVETSQADLLKRRLTIASMDEPLDDDGDIDIQDDGEYYEEEIEEIEEVVEEEEEDEEVVAPIKIIPQPVNVIKKPEDPDKYVPETFEQLNSLYRPFKNSTIPDPNEHRNLQVDVKLQTTKTIEFKPRFEEIKKPFTPEPTAPKTVAISAGGTNYPTASKYTGNTATKSDSAGTVEEKTIAAKIAAATATPVRLVENYDDGEGDAVYADDDDIEDIEEEIDEEEMYEEEQEEDVSDVDDDDLMKRLEAKYGKLPADFQTDEEEEDDEEEEEASWTKIKPRSSGGGGPQDYAADNSVEDELSRANEEMLRDNLNAALKIYESLALKYPDSPRALYAKAKFLDMLSEKYQSNQYLTKSIEGYKRYLALGTIITDEMFKKAALHCINRMRFLGLQSQAITIHESLIERFSNEPEYRNELAVTYLLTNRLNDAKSILEVNLARWPNNGFALAHYGFVLKSLNSLESSVDYLRRGIESNEKGTQDGRFYFNLGDALQRLGRKSEAMEVYRKGAMKNLFPSEYQRSLYNVENLKSQPFWTKDETTYKNFLNLLENNWRQIREEGVSALTDKGFFIDEAENLKDIGDWQQFELFARGQKNMKNCEKTPVTCKLIEIFPAARFCTRGQAKFSVMHPGTHVWPHCGPTNCRLRAHLGLKVPPGTKIRVAQEERTWQEGKFLIFDDSFEHEVWHNGTSVRLVLIVDVWHPDLSESQRNNLKPI